MLIIFLLFLYSSGSQPQYRTKESIDAISWPLPEVGVNKNHTSFTDRLLNFDKEAQSTAIVSSSSSLPSWLQNYKEESKTNPAHDKVYILLISTIAELVILYICIQTS